MSTVIRRNKQKILGLKDTSGIWVSEVETLKQMVQSFYVNLFTVDTTVNPELLPANTFPPLLPEHISILRKPFGREDVREALFDMAFYKGPGPDGIHAGFYQRLWTVTGDSICKFVLDFISSGVMPPHVNDTLIALIPK